MTDDAPFLLKSEGLAAGHGRKAVLRDVTLTIRPGEFWFFLGTNAQGKSTLLNSLIGVLPRLGGRLDAAPAIADRRALGLVPQRCDLAPNLPTTAHELVTLGLHGLGADHAEREERIAESLAAVGLKGLDHKSYWSMSGGQRQRVLVARALARRPRLLCVDEPMNNLDLVTERALLTLFARQHREDGRTIVFVTHNVSIAAHFATHVALVYDGGVAVGTPAELLEPRLLEKAYGAPVTIVPLVGFEKAAPRAAELATGRAR